MMKHIAVTIVALGICSSLMLVGCIFDEGFDGDPEESTEQTESIEEQVPGRWGAYVPDQNHRDVGIALFLEFDENGTLTLDVGPEMAPGSWSVSEEDATVTLHFSGGEQEDESVELEAVRNEEGRLVSLEGEIEAEQADGEEGAEPLELVAFRQGEAAVEVAQLDGLWRSVTSSGSEARIELLVEVEAEAASYGYDGGLLGGQEGHVRYIEGTPEVLRCKIGDDRDRTCWAVSDSHTTGEAGSSQPSYTLAGNIGFDDGEVYQVVLPVFNFDDSANIVVDGEVNAELQ